MTRHHTAGCLLRSRHGPGCNIGVEIGQLLFIALLALLLRAGRNLLIHPPLWARAVPAYAVGSLGAFWTLGRTAVLLGVTL